MDAGHQNGYCKSSSWALSQSQPRLKSHSRVWSLTCLLWPITKINFNHMTLVLETMKLSWKHFLMSQSKGQKFLQPGGTPCWSLKRKPCQGISARASLFRLRSCIIFYTIYEQNKKASNFQSVITDHLQSALDFKLCQHVSVFVFKKGGK